jgi:hypothetical protein
MQENQSPPVLHMPEDRLTLFSVRRDLTGSVRHEFKTPDSAGPNEGEGRWQNLLAQSAVGHMVGPGPSENAFAQQQLHQRQLHSHPGTLNTQLP